MLHVPRYIGKDDVLIIISYKYDECIYLGNRAAHYSIEFLIVNELSN